MNNQQFSFWHSIVLQYCSFYIQLCYDFHGKILITIEGSPLHAINKSGFVRK